MCAKLIKSTSIKPWPRGMGNLVNTLTLMLTLSLTYFPQLPKFILPNSNFNRSHNNFPAPCSFFSSNWHNGKFISMSACLNKFILLYFWYSCVREAWIARLQMWGLFCLLTFNAVHDIKNSQKCPSFGQPTINISNSSNNQATTLEELMAMAGTWLVGAGEKREWCVQWMSQIRTIWQKSKKTWQ